MSENRKVAKRAGIIGFFTLISRISGLIRDAVLAFFFGAGMQADAFYMAFTLPNLLRRFVAEGALTISFVPIFTKELKQSKEEAKRLSDQAFCYLTCVLLLLVALGIYASPWILKLMAAGFQKEPEKFQLTVTLTRLCFPYLIFVSLAALVMGILNSFKHFATPAAAPILLNVGMILGAASAPFFHPPVLGLVAGVLLGGFLQVLVQLPTLWRFGFFPRIRFSPLHSELRSLLGLMLPAAYGAAVYQLNVIIVRFFASYLPTGAVSYLWYANRLFEFPMGVFAIALATAIQPTLSDFAAEEKWDDFRNSIGYALRVNSLITIPAMVGLIVLAEPIVRVLLQRGAFDPVSAHGTATAIMAFALGLPFLGVVRIVVPAFYALRDSKTPVLFASVAVGVNLLFASLWVKPLGHNGLALAISMASMINAFGLLFVLSKKIGGFALKEQGQMIFKTSFATLVMGFLLWWPQMKGYTLSPAFSLWRQAGELGVALFVGIILFFGVSFLLGVGEVQEVLSLFKKRIFKR